MRTFGKTVIILYIPEAKSRQQMVYIAFVSQALQGSFWLKIRINYSYSGRVLSLCGHCYSRREGHRENGIRIVNFKDVRIEY